MFFWLLSALLIGAILAYGFGRSRALALANAGSGPLHSLPSYHGYWLTIMSAGLGFAVLVAWSLAASRYVKSSVLGALQSQTGALSPAQIDGLWRDINALVFGGTAGIRDGLRDQGAELLRSATTTNNILLTIAVVGVFAAGFYFAWRQITPEFRARHRVERFVSVVLFTSSSVAVLTTIGIVLSLIAESLRFFQTISIFDFLFGLTWSPQQMAFRADQAGGIAAFGFVPLFAGTLLITTIAILVAAPIGLLAAIYLSDYAGPRVRAIGKPALEVLAGIPTVVYGFFAALTVAPFVRDAGTAIGLSVSSESALAAGLVMGIMIVPFVSSLSDDVLNAVPQSLRDGSAGLGATKSETIVRVVLPAALPGIVSALLLAVSRAIGETMIVVMAAGLAANLTFNPLDAVTTVTVQIGTLLTGDQEFDSPKTLAAFALGLVLFCITLTLNVIALRVVKKYKEQYD
jgi:phosphate transport system permease protein